MIRRESVGEVVPRREKVVADELLPEAEKVETTERVAPDALWTNTPSLADQFSNEKWEATVRMGPPQIAVFELPEGQDAANKLLARSKPDGCPEIVVLRSEPLESERKLVLFVLYHLVEYRKIIGDPNTQLP